MSPLQKAKSLPKSVPSTQTRQRSNPNNTSGSGNNNNNNSGQTNSISNDKISNNINKTKQKTEMTENQELSNHIVRPVVLPNISQKKCYFEANAANRPPPRNRRPERQTQVTQRDVQNNSNVSAQVASQIMRR